MKKRILFLFITLLIATSCNNNNPNDSNQQNTSPITVAQSDNDNNSKDNHNVKDYFPVKENTIFQYVNEDVEYLNYHVFNSFIDGNKFQQMTVTNYSITDSVFEVMDDKVELYFVDMNNMFFNNFISEEQQEPVVTVLKGPIEIGTKWSSPTVGDFEITGIDVDVSVPYGDFKALEVTSESIRQGENGETHYTTIEYYAKDIGLIKVVQINDKNERHETVLENYSEDASEKIGLVVSTPDDNAMELEQLQIEINIKTNDNGKKVFESLLKSEEVGLLTENVKINELVLNIDDENNGIIEIDLSKEYVTEMNAGAGYESLLLRGLVDTLCHYSGAKGVILTIDGKSYESGHMLFDIDEVLEPSK